MRKKLIILTILCSTLLINSFSQDLLLYANANSSSDPGKSSNPTLIFEFRGYPKDSEMENVSKEMAGEHLFGDLAAKKLYLLDKYYTSQLALVPGNPQTRTVIKKPVIYDAVKRIERDLKKKVKKGELSSEIASVEMNKTLDVALNILTADTSEFEDAVTSAKSINKKIELFTKQVSLKY
jgi:hypothetical protein